MQPTARSLRSAVAVAAAAAIAALATGCSSDPPTERVGSGGTTAEPVAGSAGAPVVLFVRGGPGSGGFLEGGADEQLSDVGDTSTAVGNHGWGSLAELLAAQGLAVQQVVEGPDDEPVPLDGDLLDGIDVVVLGSNNATYPPAAADAVERFVRDGGGLLVISDANWGSDWPDAPDSDQVFLDRFDLEVNQDTGTYDRVRDDFTAPEHPVVDGVDRFDGEGVSPFTVTDRIDDVDPLIVVPAWGDVRRNVAGEVVEPAGATDAALVVAEVGRGRVVGHFDRNTFFNDGGAGTSLSRFDNARLAQSLFTWLADT